MKYLLLNFIFAGVGARKGDSGSGLIFYDNKKERYFLRGIVSAGKNEDFWDVMTSIASFTDISYYLSWLSEERKILEKEEASVKKGPTT